MKKLIALSLILLAGLASAQTITQVRLPKLIAKEAEEDLNEDASRLVRAFVGANKAQRSAACSALGISC